MQRGIVVLAIFLASAPVFAQTATGTIQGTVVDASAASVPDASVTIFNVKNGTSVLRKTSSDGRFVAPFLQPGEYQVTVEKAGFERFRRSGIKLNVQQNLELEIHLKVGDVSTTVMVEATPPPLDTATTSVGTMIENKRIIDLPLNGRSVFGLAGLAVGVNTQGGGATPQIGGGRAGTSDILIDGITTEYPSGNNGVSDGGYEPQVDAVQEFSVQVNALAAEYGRFGGGIINVAMKAGTNAIHGTAYDFLRNSKLDANGFFANRSGIAKGSFKRNQWGGTVGGPITVPGLYSGRDRTFFFFGFEGTNPRQQSIYTATVPSAAWRGGDFADLRNASGAPITLYDPLTSRDDPAAPNGWSRTPFAGNRLPAGRLSPVAVAMMKYFPEANTAPVNQYTLSNNYVVAGTPISNTYRIDPRIDHNWTQWWRAFVRASVLWANARNPMYYGNIGTPTNRSSRKHVQASFDNTFTVRPTLIANVRYGANWFSPFATVHSDGFDLTSIGLPKYYDDRAALQGREIPTMSFSGFSTLGGGGWNRYKAISSSSQMLTGSITKILSRHTIKAGAEFRVMLVNQVGNLGYASGQFSFSSGWTQKAISTNATEGFSLASFLLGLPGGGSFPHGNDPAASNHYYAGFLQDDWKATRQLTINIGLRYDLDAPRTERYNQLNYFDLSAVSPLMGKVAASACASCGDLRGAMRFVDNNNRRQVSTDFNDIGPRIGFAYNVLPDTVLRAAYGISYAPTAVGAAANGGDGADAYRSSTGFAGTYDSGRTIYATLSNPYPDGFNLPPGRTLGESTFIGMDIASCLFDGWRNPYIQQWNATLQRVLPGGIVAELGYLGSHGIGLVDGDGAIRYDQLPASAMSLGAKLTSQVANPFYGIITNPLSSLSKPAIEYRRVIKLFPQYTTVQSYRKPVASSIYHAMTVRVDKRFAKGHSFLISYTAGKLIDDASQGVNYLGQIYGSKLDFYNRRLERSISSIDVPQRFVASYVFELPFGRGRRFLRDLPKSAEIFLGGWQVNGITTFASGTPVLIFPFTNNTYIFSGQRPNSTGAKARLTGGTTAARLSRWFDTSAFTQPSDYTFGNLGRTVPDLRNPGINATDLSFFKNIAVWGEPRVNLQYRVEMFGAFNTPQWGQPGNTLQSGTFGVISSASGSRQIQMALKLIW